MKGGFSSSKGIILYDTEKKPSNGIFGYYEGNEIKFECGNFKDLLDVMNDKDEKDVNKGHLYKFIIGLFVGMILTLCISFFILPFRYFLAMLLFFLISYFPIMVIIETNIKRYKDIEKIQKFKRNHGAEHAAISLMGKEYDITIENLKKMKYYDAECGTAYAGMFIFLASVLAFIIINFTYIGFFKAIAILLSTVILLLLNILFNPYNPFLLLQRNVVEKPGDKEYELALEIIRKLRE